MSENEYICVMFPYPSGAGLHLGHVYNYAIIDSYCKWHRYKGKTVFQPFGYDAFGLPAENYAKEIGGDPKEVTMANIANFRSQMDDLRTDYYEVLTTCSPEYIKWTQWVFNKLHEHGLAYKAFSAINWCTGCETVLANEQVKEDKCERCGSDIEQREMNQWFFKITAYKDRLIKNLDHINMPESTIKQQRHWLESLQDWCVSRQRKWGCPIPIEGETDTLDTFVDSSFYFLRYLTDSEDEFLPADKYHQVDLYVGGPEHACMHLIYARFIHMFLYDIGIVPGEEPFKRVIHQGMITCNGSKMSKRGNSISPSDFNPAELRFHLMFLGPYFEGGDWTDDESIVGTRRFFARMNRWIADMDGDDFVDLVKLEQTIDYYVESFKFNKVVSTFMIFYNQNKKKHMCREDKERVAKMLNIFAPNFNE